MPFVEINGQQIELDEDGFLLNTDVWTKEAAVYLSKQEGIEELTEEHWKLIEYLRNYFFQFGIAPMIRKLCKESGFSLKQIYQLFPSGPAKGACKIAGLPKPTGCV